MLACAECQNWHRKGKHTAGPGARAEQRREIAHKTAFCAEILVPDERETYARAGGRCVMTTGAQTATEAATLASALESARWYIDPQCGYPWARVVVHALCG